MLSVPPPNSIHYDFYISPDGEDNVNRNGQINEPFKTINYCLSRMTMEDTANINIREGNYEFNEVVIDKDIQNIMC